jgi:hypothetical protein
MKKMKGMVTMMATGAMLAGAAAGALAADRGVNGLILGAGGGAILGQAIGRDTEGTLIGTAVGGVLGYIVGNEMDKQTVRPVAAHPRTVIIERDRAEDYRYAERRPWREPECRETEILAMVNGRPEVVVTTACRENGEWVVRHPGYRQQVTQVVVIEDNRHRRGGPPPGRGWRKEQWREVTWR